MRFAFKLLCIALFFTLQSTSALSKTIATEAGAVTPLLNGVQIPAVTLHYPDGSPVSLAALTMQKPTIIMFYRGGWCPYCNQQFAELGRVEKDLIALGYQILAVSPQTPDALQSQALDTEMMVTQLSDVDLSAIREFGVGFYVDNTTAERYKTYNIDLTKDETGTPVLPAPAVFIVDKKGLVQFSYVNPDFKVRPSAALIKTVATVLAGEMD
ncbi:peroxiredoxin-like family protein [Alteromonas gilva]|uniref:thioredoxin-dependent peroxiredoxin n=1 Tax=Alteromonas gilva TaxID=2987522 RepID=A0ABT5L800_9ALTE|nr:peroxiredoxin-like family protein [Alteromonas gilva]MDC8831982.1 peroxiredoxin-like family protein [Alteromonas gilva]